MHKDGPALDQRPTLADGDGGYTVSAPRRILYQSYLGKDTVPRVSSKRQITLPVEQCKALGIEPGDEIETFVYRDQLTIVKKTPGAAAGRLKHLEGTDISDEASLQDAIDQRANKRAVRGSGKQKRKGRRAG